ncbi:MAG: exosortase system-associated protein, TIGR04073 family [bacterium]|nr:exosortase system-associated protein, TIGR04073 family [bacterium]
MRKFVFALLAAWLAVVVCSDAVAAYIDDVSRKLDRGLSNVLGCWLEMPYQTWAAASERGVIAGGASGLGRGIVMLPARLLSGAADIVTFPVPCPGTGWDGMIRPEYNPWVEVPEEPIAVGPADAALEAAAGE